MAKNRHTKLELTWIGKDDVPRLEPRILLEQPEKSYAAPLKSEGPTFFDNMLIHGDNLLALKALEAQFTGAVKCIYIDPPFNTGQAFPEYEDGIEHSLWLSMFRDRLLLLKRLLADDGTIWVHLDDSEFHRARCILDETFGPENFIATVVWEKDAGRRNDTDFSTVHDYIAAYAKQKPLWKQRRNLLPREEGQNRRYRNPDNDPRGPWLQGADGTAKSGSEEARFPITLPSGRVVQPPKGNFWRFARERFEAARGEGRVYFGRDGNGMPIIKTYLTNVQDGVVPRTWWTSPEVGSNMGAKRDHLRKLLPDIEPFSTPKPEELIHRILHIATNPGELVLDSFGGSGTTAAVAHKMGRRWITVELGDHCHTHLLPRLRKVVAGTDPGGVTNLVEWKGGGGFRYFKLAPSLLERDRWGNWIISKEYNPEMLAEAMCKHEGFTYQPSESTWWQQGRSTERDFIYVTTQTLTHEQLSALSAEVGEGRSLLICCGAFKAKPDEFPNLTLKKIPNAVLGKCEWGRDDYSLKVASIQEEAATDPEPPATPSTKKADAASAKKKKAKKGKTLSAQELPLFGGSK